MKRYSYYKIVYVIKNGKLYFNRELTKCFPNKDKPEIFEVNKLILEKTTYFIHNF